MRVVYFPPHPAMLTRNELQYWESEFTRIARRPPTEVVLPAVTVSGPTFPSRVHDSISPSDEYGLTDWFKQFSSLLGPNTAYWAYIDPTFRFLADNSTAVHDQYGVPIPREEGGGCCINSSFVQHIAEHFLEEIVTYKSSGLNGVVFDLSHLFPQFAYTGAARIRSTCFCVKCTKALQSPEPRVSLETFIGETNPLRLLVVSASGRARFVDIKTEWIKSLSARTMLLAIIAQNETLVSRPVIPGMILRTERFLDPKSIIAKESDETLYKLLSSSDNVVTSSTSGSILTNEPDARELLRYADRRAQIVATAIRRLAELARHQEFRVAVILSSSEFSLRTSTDLMSLFAAEAADEFWSPSINEVLLDEKQTPSLRYLFCPPDTLPYLLYQSERWNSIVRTGYELTETDTTEIRDLFRLWTEYNFLSPAHLLDGTGAVGVPITKYNAERLFDESIRSIIRPNIKSQRGAS